MPTYKSNRQTLLHIEEKMMPSGAVHGRIIAAGAIFTAKSTSIPSRWLEQGNLLEGAEPWVTELLAEPTDEELSS